MNLTPELTLVIAQAALLFIDVQSFSAHRRGTEVANLPLEVLAHRYGWYFAQPQRQVIPNMQAVKAHVGRPGSK